MGSFESSRPGGSREQALIYFDQAIAASAGGVRAHLLPRLKVLHCLLGIVLHSIFCYTRDWLPAILVMIYRTK